MSNIRCPLCRQTEVTRRATLTRAELLALYARLLPAVDVAAELPEAACDLLHCLHCDLRFFWPQMPGSAAFYAQLQQYAWYYQSDKPEFAAARRHIPSGARILEVGCGRGAFARQLTDGRYTGLELNAEAAVDARSSGLDVRLERVEAHALTHSGQYDVVCAFQVLEHVPDVRGFVAACLDCLTADGRLILSVPNADSFVGRAVNNITNLPPHHMTWWSERALTALADEFGLVEVARLRDALAPLHRRWYVAVRLLDRAAVPPPPIDLSLRYRLLSRLAGGVARLSAPFVRPAVTGHSITVVLTKR